MREKERVIGREIGKTSGWTIKMMFEGCLIDEYSTKTNVRNASSTFDNFMTKITITITNEIKRMYRRGQA